MKTLALAIGLLLAGCQTAPRLAALPVVPHATQVAPDIVSAGRLTIADVTTLRNAGIREVIDLTPDAETPEFDEASAVRAAGMRYANLPLRGGVDLTRDNVVAFDRLLANAGRPVLVHCASGNRVGAMAALRAAWVQGRSTDEAIEVGRKWGLKGLEAEVRTRLDTNVAAPAAGR